MPENLLTDLKVRSAKSTDRDWKLSDGGGLFLLVNVVRKLGGLVSADNRDAGGAVVRITLPIAAIARGEGRRG